ncbi:uncharacterized protein LOC119995592 [Tripterygium wilfordii]|uniref:uncharacterized protein LOC119995592 n=1 Tax=Tripterygium wilfordii TaxID=458696 RepID=UPI0018F7F70A|nr:uncharacterized protein LOC119995592 [Tripterygium wilfordii]
MHIEKNVFDNIFNTCKDVKGKTKDNGKSRLDLSHYCKRRALELVEYDNEEAKATLEKLWAEPDYVRKREKAKINRASETDGCTNTGGSISHSEHKKRLEKELGRPPTNAELFRHCHIKKATKEFVERRTTTTYNDNNKLKEAHSSQASTSEESPLEPQDDDSIFMEATKYVNKKGRIYGLGSKASHMRFSSSYNRPSRSGLDYLQQEIEERIARMSS